MKKRLHALLGCRTEAFRTYRSVNQLKLGRTGTLQQTTESQNNSHSQMDTGGGGAESQGCARDLHALCASWGGSWQQEQSKTFRPRRVMWSRGKQTLSCWFERQDDSGEGSIYTTSRTKHVYTTGAKRGSRACIYKRRERGIVCLESS